MPKNEDFEYDGLKVDHANNWSARDYHNQSFHPSVRKPTKEMQPPSSLKNVVRRPKKGEKPTPSQDQAIFDLVNKQNRLWPSNNEIIDN